MLRILAVSLGLTLLLELGFALLWGLRGRRELTVVVLVNILTNPAVVLSYHTAVGLWGWDPAPVTLVLECAAVAVEWLCFRACSEQLRKPFLFALLANGFSYGVGCVINLLIGIHSFLLKKKRIKRKLYAKLRFAGEKRMMKKLVTLLLALTAMLSLTAVARADAISSPVVIVAYVAYRYFAWILVGLVVVITIILLRKFRKKK